MVVWWNLKVDQTSGDVGSANWKAAEVVIDVLDLLIIEETRFKGWWYWKKMPMPIRRQKVRYREINGLLPSRPALGPTQPLIQGLLGHVWGKRGQCVALYAPPFKCKRVKKRIKLYLYSLYMPLWQVIGWSLPDRIKGMYCTWSQYLHYYLCAFNAFVCHVEVKHFIPPILHIAVMSKSRWQWMCNV